MSDAPQMSRKGLPPFPFGECAFYGLNSWKQNFWPVTLRIALPNFLLGALISLPAMLLMGRYFHLMSHAMQLGESGKQIEMLQMIGWGALIWFVMMFLWLIIYSSTFNASLRWLLNNDLNGQFGALRFGRDEFRTLLVTITYFLFVFVLSYLLFLALAFVGGIVGGILGGIAGSSGRLVMSFVLIGILLFGFLGMIIFTVFFSIRLALCVPTSLDQRKFVFWDSMRLTKKRGWALLGTYLIMGLIYFGVTISVSTIGQVILSGSNNLMMMFDPTHAGNSPAKYYQMLAERYSSPEQVIPIITYSLISLLVATVFMMAYSGLSAYALRFLEEEKGDIVGQLDVFD